MKRNIFINLLKTTTKITLLSSLSLSYCDNTTTNTNNTTTTNNNNNKKDSKVDCHIPACNSTRDMLKLAKLQREKNLNNNNNNNNNIENVENNKNNKNDKLTSTISNKEKESNPYKTGCPILREELGVSTWKLIHTIAANYPETPTELDKQNVKKFFETLSYLYPCPHCAEDFQSSVANNPPRVSSREELSLWCCELHNEVNRKLGLPVFPCSLVELDIRWKFGREDCWKE